jgi:hypothetical protein
MMEHTDTYITCTRRKGQQKKHVTICSRCRWKSTCEPYQAHILSETREKNDAVLTICKKPFMKNDLLNFILKELSEIKLLLSDYESLVKDSTARQNEMNDTLENENIVKYVMKELTQIKSLL